MAQNIPTDAHTVGDPGHTTDHNNIADMLGLLSSVLAQASGTGGMSTIPPASQAVTALQAMLTSQPLLKPHQFVPEAYGAAGNGIVVTDAAITSGLAVLTSASNGFATAAAGQPILVQGAGDATGVRTLVTTILSVQSAGQVTLNANAAATVTGQWAVFGTDDTAAINAALAAATAYAQANTNEAEVVFGAKLYMVAGAPTQGGTTKGNAQIPLPQVALSAPKLVIKFTGLSDTPTINYGINSTTVAGSCALVCARADGTNSGSFGPASVIGGPTLQQTSGTCTSNVRLVITGLSILLPYNSTYCGVDTYGCVGLCVRSLAVNVLGTPTQVGNPSSGIASGNRYAFGLRTPTLTNDGDIVIDNYVAYGVAIGLMFSEHVSASRGFCVYCYIGLAPYGAGDGTGNNHTSRLHVWCCEACNQQIAFNSFADTPTRVDIGTFDIDGGAGPSPLMINDPSSQGFGEINIRGHSNVYTFSTGMASLRVVSGDQVRGTVTPPAVPATTVALLNPFWRDASVTIATAAGVTVSAVTVDGAATGTTLAASTNDMVIVPTGKTIALTYAGGTPTWTWVLM